METKLIILTPEGHEILRKVAFEQKITLKEANDRAIKGFYHE